MSHATHNIEQEFWRPPVQTEVQEVRPAVEICPRCNTEYLVGSRFCYICGAQRESEAHSASAESSILHLLDIRLIGNALGLSVASLVAFVVGLVCVIAAFVTGFIYTATTLVDWQAVQIWRIEWLLAAAVAFIAGILLKRSAV